MAPPRFSFSIFGESSRTSKALCHKGSFCSVIASTRDRWPRNTLANHERKFYETRGNRGITQFERQRFPWRGVGRRVDHYRARGRAGRTRERLERPTRCFRSRALAAALELGPLGDALRGSRLRGCDTGLA